jgi:hypothetical protein
MNGGHGVKTHRPAAVRIGHVDGKARRRCVGRRKQNVGSAGVSESLNDGFPVGVELREVEVGVRVDQESGDWVIGIG